jgi:hypothetical protein
MSLCIRRALLLVEDPFVHSEQADLFLVTVLGDPGEDEAVRS